MMPCDGRLIVLRYAIYAVIKSRFPVVQFRVTAQEYAFGKYSRRYFTKERNLVFFPDDPVEKFDIRRLM